MRLLCITTQLNQYVIWTMTGVRPEARMSLSWNCQYFSGRIYKNSVVFRTKQTVRNCLYYIWICPLSQQHTTKFYIRSSRQFWSPARKSPSVSVPVMAILSASDFGRHDERTRIASIWQVRYRRLKFMRFSEKQRQSPASVSAPAKIVSDRWRLNSPHRAYHEIT